VNHDVAAMAVAWLTPDVDERRLAALDDRNRA
jgi:hypothetical protein